MAEAQDLGSCCCGFESHLRYYTLVTQRLECDLYTVEVVGSNPTEGTCLYK